MMAVHTSPLKTLHLKLELSVRKWKGMTDYGVEFISRAS